MIPRTDYTIERIVPRSDLLVASWLKRKLPLRDYLLGNVICTTSRWLIFGETGVGKTLFALGMAGAMSAGRGFLGWLGRRPCRVMYLDGEMPPETFKERIELIAAEHGPDLQLYGYNRDVLGDDDMPPLNTDAGQAWLWKEIELVKPDAIFFDSIMCLLIGSMSEEEAWAPIKSLMRALSSRRIAQVWLHHTGHDASRSYGTKTREWELDSVVSLAKSDEDQNIATATLKFEKSRLRTPTTSSQFQAQVIRYADGTWRSAGTPPPKQSSKDNSVAAIKKAILDAYDRLADGVAASPGLDGKLVRKITTAALKDEVRSRGFLETSDGSDALTATGRSHWSRAKTQLLTSGALVEAEKKIWRSRK